MGELRDRLIAAQANAKKLNALTDELNRLLELLERTLVGMRLSVEARLECEDAILCFTKVDGAWGIFLFQEGRYHRITKASRQMRLAAVQLLEPLVCKMIESVEAQRERVEEANRTVEEVIASLDSLPLVGESNE